VFEMVQRWAKLEKQEEEVNKKYILRFFKITQPVEL